MPRDDGVNAASSSSSAKGAKSNGKGCTDNSHKLGEAGCRSAAAFDPMRVRKFTVTIAKADRARMPGLAANEMTEGTYVPAELSIDGEHLGTVGIRYKGSNSLRSCIAPDLTLTCDKISYKIKFDAYDSEKRWNGLKKVNLHSMIADPTLMHEHLAYRLFRAMRIAAPRAAHAQVSVNGEAPGVFALTEEVDGRFTSDRFAPGGDGNLYKEVWPVSTERDFYQQALETSGATPQDHAPFIAFARALENAPRSQRGAVVAARTDPAYLLRYLAVDRILSNWDGVTTFYCASEHGDDCGNHNSYWYVDEPGTHFWLIPWDLDNTWLLHSKPESLLPKWNETPADCSARAPWNGSFLVAPGCDPLLQGLADLGKTGYRDALSELLAGPFRVADLHAEIDRIATLIRPAVMADPTLDVQSFASHVAELKQSVTLLREKAELMHDGKNVNPFALRTSGPNDFEAASNVTLAMGTAFDPNPGTTASRTLNQDAPLRGSADLRADFEYRTGSDPYTWLNLSVDLQSAPVDLRRVRSVRMVLKADKARGGRIELDSGAYTEHEGIRYGWDIAVGPRPTTLTLNLAELEPPRGERIRDSADVVLASIERLMVQIDSEGLDASGFFPTGRSDKGYIELDDIEFLQ